MEEELNLTKYLDMLIRRWRLVLGVVLLAVLVAVVSLLLQPRLYQARVLVATVKAITQVSFDTAIKTLSEDDLGPVIDRQQRLASFVQMVSSPAIAEQVLAQVGDRLPEEERELEPLLKLVKGRIAAGTDSIEILVTHEDPDVALAIANAWGQAYVQQVNTVYGGTENESYVAVQQEVKTAQAAYEREQGALVEFLAQDRFGELNRRIAQAQALIQNLMNARSAVIPNLLNNIWRIERLLSEAQDMRAQVQALEPGALVNSEIALILLKADVFTSNMSGQLAPVALQGQAHPLDEGQVTLSSGVMTAQSRGSTTLQLQPNVSPMTAAQMAADLDSLIATLEQRQGALKRELNEVMASTTEGDDWSFLNAALSPTEGAGSGEGGVQMAETIRQLEQQVRDLRAELTQEESRLRELQSRRDLAWNTYDTLRRKEAELAIAAQTKGVQVRLAVPAAAPQQTATSRVKTLATAIVVGLVLGIVAVLAVEFWQGYRARALAVARAQ